MNKAELDKRDYRRALKSSAILATAPATALTEAYRANRIDPDHTNLGVEVEGIRALTEWVGDKLADAGGAGLATCESNRAAPHTAGHA